jgi:DnaK suppressor protein
VLLALRARLRGDMTQMADATLNGHHRETGSIPLDTADLASDNFEQDVTLSLLGSATGALAQIENALERVNEGTYGQCEQCGDKIPAARLDALPHTTMCVQCASRQEKRGRW